jgi:hypothetical protein
VFCGIGLVVMDVRVGEEAARFTARAGRPDVITVEQH